MSDVWKGVSLPWGTTIRSLIDPKSDEEVLRSSVLWIVMTRRGERVMRPEFGSALPDALFEQNDEVLVSTTTHSVRDAIERWDDRIQFVQMQVEQSGERLDCRLFYRNAKDPRAAEQLQVAEFELIPSVGL